MVNKRSILVLCVFLLCGMVAFGQPWNFRYGDAGYSDLSALYRTSSSFHTSVRPYLQPEVDSLQLIYATEHSERSRLARHLFHTDMISFQEDDFQFTINPLMNFGYGSEQVSGDPSWTNTRAILVEGAVGNDFAFSTRFYENQALFPGHIQEMVSTYGVVPGQGDPRGLDGAMDYASAEGYVSYTPGNYFNFQLGHGRNFFGDGYRSMMLSDQALAYPYFKITSTIWKFKYVNMWAQFNHPYGSRTQGLFPFPKKYGTFHYLSFTGGKRWTLSLFEAIMWQAQDSSGYRGFELNYINPMIFYRPVEFTLSSPDNAFMGANFSFEFHDWLTGYSQFVIDEFRLSEIKAGNGWHGNKYALQLGLKSFNPFKLKGLYLQYEYNMVRPYMYSHYLTTQSYSHNNEPLGYAFGANTRENVVIARYHYKRFFAHFKFNQALYGLDDGGVNYGKNILLNYQDYWSDYGNEVAQGVHTNFKQVDATVSYLLNPATNLNVFASYTWRKTDNERDGVGEIRWFHFGLRTSLRSLYYDFY